MSIQTSYVGYYIRQLRRERSLTQAELGNNLFSKSYVSAVENGKLVPSTEALTSFATRLGEVPTYFLELSRQIEASRPSHAIVGLVPQEQATLLQEKAALLDALLEQHDYNDFQISDVFFQLSEEALSSLPVVKQAHYFFLQGLMYQKKEEYQASIQAFEDALPKAGNLRERVAILDALGCSYIALHLYQVALHYYIRASQLYVQGANERILAYLAFQVETHCGDACLALGEYQNAIEHFGKGRTYLTAHQNMRDAGRLYWSLGYCTYAFASQQVAEGIRSQKEVEALYEQALGYLIQSQNIYQLSGDWQEEARTRLAQAQTQLDMSIWLQTILAQKTSSAEKSLLTATISSLLDEALEQSQQIIIAWRAHDGYSPAIKHERVVDVVSGLALRVRITVQRALFAHTSGHEHTALREKTLAVSLCQQLLEASQDDTLFEQLIWHAGNISDPLTLPSQSLALPRLPGTSISPEKEESPINCLSQGEMYFAAGEVAEMLGKMTVAVDFVSDCYTRADVFFQSSLAYFGQMQMLQRKDPGRFHRKYQRYVLLLEERLVDEVNSEQTARALFALCKKYFASP